VAAQASVGSPYPVTFDVTYPERLSRLTTLIRPIWAIPIFIVVATIGGVTTFPLVLLLLFRGKYPRWWYDWNLELSRFSARVGAYLFLLRDEYPSVDEEQAVHLNFPYPEPGELSRWLPLVKWLLAIPHYIVLYLLWIILSLLTFVAWVIILVTGRYPRPLFDFAVGVTRWGQRVNGYVFLLVTDRYPPFSFR
jgi:hypothetical protein